MKDARIQVVTTIKADIRYNRSVAEALIPKMKISNHSTPVFTGSAPGVVKLCRKTSKNPKPNPSKLAAKAENTTAKIATTRKCLNSRNINRLFCHKFVACNIFTVEGSSVKSIEILADNFDNQVWKHQSKKYAYIGARRIKRPRAEPQRISNFCHNIFAIEYS